MNSALAISNIQKSFGGLSALSNVNFSVRTGRLTALIGPNGAGKTTLFNIISGLIRPDRGSVQFLGRDVTTLSAQKRAKLGMLRTFQLSRGFPKLSVFEHLMLYGRNQPGEKLLEALLESPAARLREEELAEKASGVAARLKLTNILDMPVTNISGGQKKLLEIGRALMAEPDLVLLDEPVAGVNPALAGEIAEHLRDIVSSGTTILLVEHNMSFVRRVSDHVVVMALGQNLAEGTYEQIVSNEAVQDAYLGARR